MIDFESDWQQTEEQVISLRDLTEILKQTDNALNIISVWEAQQSLQTRLMKS